MTGPAFTVLLPVVRPPAMLPYAIKTVLKQERQDFELFVICDGTPPETVACAEEFAATDPRIRVFAHPKGEGKGELYRHEALQHARGEYVCQLGDDDLLLPNHLAEMAKLLHEVDFGNVSHLEIRTDGQPILLFGDLGDAATRQRMLNEQFNFLGATAAGYRLSAYRSLTVGWAPAPPTVASDLNMWRKFLARDDLRFGTRVAVTVVKCSAGHRRDWPIERRAAEIKAWAARLEEPSGPDTIVQLGLGDMNRRCYAQQGGIEQLTAQAQRLKARIEELRTGSSANSPAATDVKALQRQLSGRTQQVQKLRQKLRSTKRTRSWRLTRPFRRLARWIGRKSGPS